MAADMESITTTFRLASPCDLIWRSNFEAAQKNSSLAFWRVPTEQTHAEPDDRIAIDFLYCGKDTKPEPSCTRFVATLTPESGVLSWRAFHVGE